MPMENFHSVRLHDPKGYKSFATKKDAMGPGIDAVFGIKPKAKEGPRGGRSVVQSLRFDCNKFSAKEAKEWASSFAEKHGHKIKEFVPAKVMGEDAAITTTSVTSDAYAYRAPAMATASRFGDYQQKKVKESKKSLSRLDRFFTERGIR